MGYYQAISLKVDKKNNKISGKLADSNWRDCNNKMIYDEHNNMYADYNVIEDKIACLYYDIICGNIHTSISKYADLVCSFDYFKEFTNRFREVRGKKDRKDYDLYNVYLEYKDMFDRYLVKNCILRQKEKWLGSTYLYIKRVNRKSYSLTYSKEKARKFNDLRVKQNELLMEDYIIEYI